MKISSTIEMTRKEVLAMLTAKISDAFRYKSLPDGEATNFCLSIDGSLVITWKEPEEEPEKDEPAVYSRAELPPADTRGEHDKTL